MKSIRDEVKTNPDIIIGESLTENYQAIHNARQILSHNLCNRVQDANPKYYNKMFRALMLIRDAEKDLNTF